MEGDNPLIPSTSKRPPSPISSTSKKRKIAEELSSFDDLIPDVSINFGKYSVSKVSYIPFGQNLKLTESLCNLMLTDNLGVSAQFTVFGSIAEKWATIEEDQIISLTNFRWKYDPSKKQYHAGSHSFIVVCNAVGADHMYVKEGKEVHVRSVFFTTADDKNIEIVFFEKHIAEVNKMEIGKSYLVSHAKFKNMNERFHDACFSFINETEIKQVNVTLIKTVVPATLFDLMSSNQDEAVCFEMKGYCQSNGVAVLKEQYQQFWFVDGSQDSGKPLMAVGRCTKEIDLKEGDVVEFHCHVHKQNNHSILNVVAHSLKKKSSSTQQPKIANSAFKLI